MPVISANAAEPGSGTSAINPFAAANASRAANHSRQRHGCAAGRLAEISANNPKSMLLTVPL